MTKLYFQKIFPSHIFPEHHRILQEEIQSYQKNSRGSDLIQSLSVIILVACVLGAAFLKALAMDQLLLFLPFALVGLWAGEWIRSRATQWLVLKWVAHYGPSQYEATVFFREHFACSSTLLPYIVHTVDAHQVCLTSEQALKLSEHIYYFLHQEKIPNGPCFYHYDVHSKNYQKLKHAFCEVWHEKKGLKTSETPVAA